MDKVTLDPEPKSDDELIAEVALDKILDGVARDAGIEVDDGKT